MLQVQDGIVPVGPDNAICVQVSESFGVVCLIDGDIRCVTCKYGGSSCKHVKYVVQSVENSTELISSLTPYAEFLALKSEAATKKTKPATPTCMSRSPIPFELPSHLKEVLKQDTSERFNLQSGVAHLMPASSTSTCPKCTWSSEVIFGYDSILVTPHCSYPAKGRSYDQLSSYVACCISHLGVSYNGSHKWLLHLNFVSLAKLERTTTVFLFNALSCVCGMQYITESALTNVVEQTCT